MSPEAWVGVAGVGLPCIGMLLALWIRSAITAAKLDTNKQITKAKDEHNQKLNAVHVKVEVVQVELTHIKEGVAKLEKSVTDTWQELTTHSKACDPDREVMHRKIDEIRREKAG